MNGILKTTIIILFLFVGIKSFALSPVTLGVKAGASLSSIDNGGQFEDTKSLVGYHFGITADYYFNKQYLLMSGLELTQKGIKNKDGIQITNLDYSEGDLKDEIFRPIYLQLPIHFGYVILDNGSYMLIAHAGGYAAYGIAGKYKITGGQHEVFDVDIDLFGKNGILNRFDYGLSGGVSVEFGNIAINLGYDHGLINLLKSDLFIKRFKTQSAHLTVGYKFDL